MPDIFNKFPQFETDPAGYYRAYPEFSRRAEREPVHPQIVAENAPDSAHLEYVHQATVTPRVLDWKIVDQEWQFVAGWPDARSHNPDDLALRFHSHLFGLLSTVFDDLEIWRYQKYVENPALSKVDAKGYVALRKWAAQFYDVPPNVTASA
jgi:3-Ketosteroid 9alpha-hydroxylase C-terminal domain